MRTVIELEILVFFVGVLAAIGFQFLAGRATAKSLLSGSRRDGRPTISRFQLLVLALAQAGVYAWQAVQTPHQIPSPPLGLLVAYGGSSAVYVGAKAGPHIRSWLKGE